MRRLFCRVTLTNILILLLILTLLFNISLLLQILSTIEMRNKEEVSSTRNKDNILKDSRIEDETLHQDKLNNIPLLHRRGLLLFSLFSQ